MKTLAELSILTNQNVIEALRHDDICYHLLIQSGENFYTSYYVEGQPMGVTLKGTPSSRGKNPYKRKPVFESNVT